MRDQKGAAQRPATARPNANERGEARPHSRPESISLYQCEKKKKKKQATNEIYARKLRVVTFRRTHQLTGGGDAAVVAVVRAPLSVHSAVVVVPPPPPSSTVIHRPHPPSLPPSLPRHGPRHRRRIKIHCKEERTRKLFTSQSVPQTGTPTARGMPLSRLSLALRRYA